MFCRGRVIIIFITPVSLTFSVNGDLTSSWCVRVSFSNSYRLNTKDDSSPHHLDLCSSHHYTTYYDLQTCFYYAILLLFLFLFLFFVCDSSRVSQKSFSKHTCTHTRRLNPPSPTIYGYYLCIYTQRRELSQVHTVKVDNAYSTANIYVVILFLHLYLSLSLCSSLFVYICRRSPCLIVLSSSSSTMYLNKYVCSLITIPHSLPPYDQLPCPVDLILPIINNDGLRNDDLMYYYYLPLIVYNNNHHNNSSYT